jgi:SAM-dependent methyltransferase
MQQDTNADLAPSRQGEAVASSDVMGATETRRGPVPCPVCAATGARLAVHHQGKTLYECRECALLYLDPPPTPLELAESYADTYSGATQSYFTKVEKKLRRSRGRARDFAAAMPGGQAAGRRFLDVGCSGGFMVEAAREAGFEAHGLEADGPALQFAQHHFPGNTWWHGLLGRVDLGDLRFDAVYCSEVIEHAPDCHGFVAELARLMKPGALLYLTTPDLGHWRRPRDVTRWDAYCPPSHCVYYSRPNLRRLLADHGLEVKRFRWAFKPGIKLFARKV